MFKFIKRAILSLGGGQPAGNEPDSPTQKRLAALLASMPESQAAEVREFAKAVITGDKPLMMEKLAVIPCKYFLEIVPILGAIAEEEIRINGDVPKSFRQGMTYLSEYVK